MSDDFDDLDLPDPPIGDTSFGGSIGQADIDALFNSVGAAPAPKHGLRALIESDAINHDRLPMLEVMYDRMVRTFTTSMRNLTSDSIDVSLDEVTSVRFSDFIGYLALPAMIGVFRVEEWENYGLITIESSLIYAVVDALLGGRKGGQSLMIDGRGFTTIETSLVARMLSLALTDMTAALQPIAVGTAKLERIETNPRFAAIAGPTNVCAVATFRVDMDGRGGRFSILLPYATIEPVRGKLAQRFMGEKLGRDTIWESHLAAELRKTELTVSVVLGERRLPLQTIRDFAVGQTIALDRSPEDLVELQCSGVLVARAHIGQRNRNIAIRLANDIAREALP